MDTPSAALGASPSQQGITAGERRRYGRVAALAVGDLVIFAVFALTGQSSHHEAGTLSSVIRIAAPFVVAWFVAGAILGAFGRFGSAATTTPRGLLPRAALSWVVACPLALILRALGEGHGIPLAFAIISFVFNGILLLGWRGIATALLWRR
jgi:hypothetical protein